MELHICLSRCRSLEIHMNEDGRAAGGEQEEMHQFITNQVFHASAMEMRQITFRPTWIHTDKEHVEEHSCQEESLETEGAGASQPQSSV